MTSRFATITATAKHEASVVIWEEGEAGPKPVGYVATAEEALEQGAVEIWQFDVPTTFDTAKHSHSDAWSPSHDAFNHSQMPVADADGAPLWQGARVKVVKCQERRMDLHFNATVNHCSEWQQVNLTADRDLPQYARLPGQPVETALPPSPKTTFAQNEYHREGPLKGIVTLNASSGTSMHMDVWGHREKPYYVRLIQDPRDVCHRIDLLPTPK